MPPQCCCLFLPVFPPGRKSNSSTSCTSGASGPGSHSFWKNLFALWYICFNHVSDTWKMIPSLTSGVSSWAGHMGLGPWGPRGAGQTPAWPPSACHTGGWRGRSPRGDLLPEALYFSSEKKWRTFLQLAMGLTTAAHWQGMVLWGCHVPAPSTVPGPCRGRRSLFQVVLGRACQREQGRVWGRCKGGRQGKVWEKMLFMQGCVCAGMHACQGKGGMQWGTPGCGEQLRTGTGTALWGLAGSFSEVDTGSFLM